VEKALAVADRDIQDQDTNSLWQTLSGIICLNVRDAFCQFCGIYGINNFVSRLEVIRGRW